MLVSGCGVAVGGDGNNEARMGADGVLFASSPGVHGMHSHGIRQKGRSAGDASRLILPPDM